MRIAFKPNHQLQKNHPSRNTDRCSTFTNFYTDYLALSHDNSPTINSPTKLPLSSDYNDEAKTTPFRIEILETYYSYYLEWRLLQIGVGEVESAFLPEGDEFYEEQLCLDPRGCYRFDLKHGFGNALSDGGSYSIFYDDILIGSGGAFTQTLRSIQFW